MSLDGVCAAAMAACGSQSVTVVTATRRSNRIDIDIEHGIVTATGVG
ncbi:MAG TPA: hypothetical protein VFH80_31030 [Solirubrobacteraceae bacterium]|nr:hypothetical protein [Solirubrobacteraceae bacterium]